LRVFNEQVIESLEAMALALPGKDMQAGETWTLETNYTFPTGLRNAAQTALFRLTCKHTGTRMRNGREEAVVELAGQVVRGMGNNNNNAGGDNADNGNAPPGGGGVDRGGRGGPGGSENTSDETNQRRGISGFAYGGAIVDVATGHVILGRIESDMA